MLIESNNVYHGDCLEVLFNVDDKTIDMILCDLPYGTTQNQWDSIIDPAKLWKHYRRIVKDNGVVLLFGCGIFSATMILEAKDLYKYTLIWKKNKSTGFLNAKKQPLRIHEDIMVFYDKQPTYNPQKTTGHKPVNAYKKNATGTNYGKTKGIGGGGSTERYPTTVLDFSIINNDDPEKVHPTQKPVKLGEYLIKTYSNEGDLVLDNSCGSGSFLVAAKNCNRRYIGIDNDTKYVELAKKRLENTSFGRFSVYV